MVKPFELDQTQIGPSILKPYQPTILTPKSWVGIDDLDLIRYLTDSLGTTYPAEAVGVGRKLLTDPLSDAFGNRLAVIDRKTLSDGMEGLIARVDGDDPDCLVVAFDPHIIPSRPHIHITRLMSKPPPGEKGVGKYIGHGPRPGYPPLQEQIAKLKETHPKARRVTLVDEVVFTANTVADVADEFTRQGLIVTNVVAGISSKEKPDELTRRGIAFWPLIVALDNIDVVNLRDAEPIEPLGGRTIGEMSRRGPQAYVDKNGISFSYPYIAREGKPDHWATVPPTHVYSVSRAGWEAALHVQGTIGKTLGRDVTLGDLPRVQGLRTSFPGPPPKRMTENGLDPNIPVSSVLAHKLGKLIKNETQKE